MDIVWKGVFPAATTQFDAEQQVDLPATAAHFDGLVAAGVQGLIVLGSLGENGSLEPSEKLGVLAAAVDAARGRVPVLAGVAEASTARACRFARDAEKAGASGLMVLPAMIYKSDPRETIAHFRSVARASRLPVLCYNNPVAYGVDLTPAMFAELSDEPTLVAIKESSGDVRRITELANRCGGRYALFMGMDDLALEGVAAGVDGWVAGLVNAFPEETMHFWRLATSGRWEEAREVYRWFAPLLHLDALPKFVQYIKLAQQECGRGSERVRAPRLALEGEEREQVLGLIRRGVAGRPLVSA
ncbi:MAG: dihydrodipicolinate synthase family protein [Planctomycetes bacterium]|nr:dihydrodipicolinate synthase family protein [Planctomycetota bacterium]